MFKTIYESHVAGGGGRGRAEDARPPRPATPTWELEELKRLKREEVAASIEAGTLLDAWARVIMYVRPRNERRRRAAVQPVSSE